MTTIQAAVEKLAYEKDPWAPFCYEPETLAQLEDLLGASFPDDFRWYLANVGWRKLDYGEGTILVPFGEYLQSLAFEAAENQVFVKSRYNDFVAGREGGRLPGEARHYFPFGQIKGGNPHVSLRLLVRLAGEDRGSIWAVRTIGHFDKEDASEPLRLADDLARFIAQLGSQRELVPIAEKNNKALFSRLLKGYVASPHSEPTRATDPKSLIATFFEEPETFVFDGPHNVEYQYRFYGHGVESPEAFARKADWFARPDNDRAGLFPGPLLRSQISYGEPRVFDFPAAYADNTSGFRLVTVESSVGDGFRLAEHFLLYDSQDSWTLVRRHDAAIDNARIKGAGTFAFDATYKWKLKKKVTPAWSNLPLELQVDGDEDALTKERIAFIKDVVGRAEFRPEFEACVFRLYTDRMYPEFEAMSDNEKEEWADSYPRLSHQEEIWRLLGKKLTVTVLNDTDFQIHANAKWDPEHGLTVDIRDWRIVQAA